MNDLRGKKVKRAIPAPERVSIPAMLRRHNILDKGPECAELFLMDLQQLLIQTREDEREMCARELSMKLLDGGETEKTPNEIREEAAGRIRETGKILTEARRKGKLL